VSTLKIKLINEIVGKMKISAPNCPTFLIAIRYRSVQKDPRTNKMTMKFLLHKDIKEIATEQMAHLVLPHPQANPSAKPKEPFFANAPTRMITLQIDNNRNK
jgi:hypothetical protein